MQLWRQSQWHWAVVMVVLMAVLRGKLQHSELHSHKL